MPRLTLAGHPVHALTSDFPVALLSTAPIFDLLALATGRRSFGETARYLQIAGLASGAAVAAAGIADYTTISKEQRELKKHANMHALLNVAVMSLTTLGVSLRKKEEPSSASALAISSAASLLLVASAWYGGEMIYELGMRVKGVSPVAGTPELKLPFIERLREPLSRFADLVAPRAGSSSSAVAIAEGALSTSSSQVIH